MFGPAQIYFIFVVQCSAKRSQPASRYTNTIFMQICEASKGDDDDDVKKEDKAKCNVVKILYGLFMATQTWQNIRNASTQPLERIF